MRFVTGPRCPDHLIFGTLSGSVCLRPLSVLRILLIGHILLVSWSSGFLFFPVSTGLPGDLILVLVVSHHVELLILYELWAGERLSSEKALPRYLRPKHPISVPAVPFGPGIDI